MLTKKVEKMSLSTKIVEILVDNDIFKFLLVDKDSKKKDMFPINDSSSCGLIIEMVGATCGSCFFRHLWATWPSFS
jgi:hypothetical protein